MLHSEVEEYPFRHHHQTASLSASIELRSRYVADYPTHATGTRSTSHRVPFGRTRTLLLDARAARAVRPTADEGHRDDGRADRQARVVGDWVGRRERRRSVVCCLFPSEGSVGMMQICL